MTRFAEDFQAHHGEPATVTEVTRDMSRAFIKGDTSHFPEAAITFDKCQGIKFLGDAVDQVRREERNARPELVGTRYLWLKHPQDRKVAAAGRLADLREAHVKIGRGRRKRLRTFCWATPSRLEPIRQAARTITAHWAVMVGVVYPKSPNECRVGGLNSLVQAAKARTRGCRKVNHFIAVINLMAGKLSVLRLTLGPG